MALTAHPMRLLATLLLLLAALASRGQGCAVSGTLADDNNGEAVGFAIVSMEGLDLRVQSDINGAFAFSNVPEGEWTLRVECLGYATLTRRVRCKGNVSLRLRLKPGSLALPEVEVMARSRGSKYTVGQTALEYIQPTSLADVMLLLPGSVYRENDLTRFTPISTRQVGSDDNSALGVSVMADGVAISTDGMRSQLVGLTQNGGSNDTEIAARSGVNQGVDMRYISTDHIQSVDFQRGISSARYGNLTGGTVQIHSKRGASPLRARLKSDLRTSLAYAGKGWRLGARGGTLHLGVDFLHATNDPRENMDKFNRLTAQAFYSNRFRLLGMPLDMDVRLSQTVTMNKMKKDELTYEYDETYKADYSRTALMWKATLNASRPWLDRLEAVVSADYTRDRVTRHKMVLSGSGPMNMPLAWQEGEMEGIYLPGKYYSDFHIDNQPVNINVQLHASTRFTLMQGLGTSILYGLEYTDVKNHGRGAVIDDPARPPFPYDNSYMRPRPNYAIPAMRTGAGYLQAGLALERGIHTLSLQAGVRATCPMNLPHDYWLNHRLMADPRLNVSYTVGSRWALTLRAGYGRETKMPTMDYLYPEKVYKDFYMLNAYTTEPERRHLITYTRIYDPSNRRLRPNTNNKWEAGADLAYGRAQLSLTAFYERSTRGFEYMTTYTPATYTVYTTLLPGADVSGRRPEKSDYVAEQYSLFNTFRRVMNSSKVTKRGIEYRLSLPEIKLLRTSVEVNGAWYQTDYASSLPTYWYPAAKIGGKEYPYVGIYDNGSRNRYSRLNTNVWLNTHIPRFKLMLTNFVQFVWLNTSQYSDNRCYDPQQYIDFSGAAHEVDATTLARIESQDGLWRYLRRTILPINYARDKKPVSVLWNIKATKEFGNGTKLSFFVNRIIDISPKYLSGSRVTRREWNDPFFGLELYYNFKL